MMNDCEKFDVFNNKWTLMPPLNHARGKPGTILTFDRRYLYAFYGNQEFIENNPDKGYANDICVHTFERLDLLNKSLGWQVIDVQNP